MTQFKFCSGGGSYFMHHENLSGSSETFIKLIEFLTVMKWREAAYKGK